MQVPNRTVTVASIHAADTRLSDGHLLVWLSNDDNGQRNEVVTRLVTPATTPWYFEATRRTQTSSTMASAPMRTRALFFFTPLMMVSAADDAEVRARYLSKNWAKFAWS